MIRGYEEQFKGKIVKQIQGLLCRINSIKLSQKVSRYYLVDLSLCLQAGALLGALHLSSTILELTIREMVIKLTTDALPKTNNNRNIEKELEDKRHLGFSKLVEILESEGFFDSKDAELSLQFYKDVRIPLHHGLPRRFVSNHDDFLFDFHEKIFGGTYHTTMHDFERVIEEKSLSLIETAIGIIERNQKLNARNHGVERDAE
ncbi:MAG: hypothetical protein PHP23_07270 [Desulfobacterales bacterium]|nr:hypothetical protein [Desulfobacterales bacterium]MDD4072189.1 hypothetical protein [Desulfobacterales bacterium]MDD4391865.1 hypothetical protein [Desulfobacterales bacterium]